jgi:hypothetical protein
MVASIGAGATSFFGEWVWPVIALPVGFFFALLIIEILMNYIGNKVGIDLSGEED